MDAVSPDVFPTSGSTGIEYNATDWSITRGMSQGNDDTPKLPAKRGKAKVPPRQRGRPRAFDRQEGLLKAMRLFWKLGYESTSMADLRAALGVTQASLYAAYGNKEALFREAVDLYRSWDGIGTAKALLEEPTAKGAIVALLRNAVDLFSQKDAPGGCLVVLGALKCGPENESVQDHLASFRRKTAKDIATRLKRGQSAGELPRTIDTGALAAYYTTVLHGLSIQARDGASHQTLTQVVDCALAAFPSV